MTVKSRTVVSHHRPAQPKPAIRRKAEVRAAPSLVGVLFLILALMGGLQAVVMIGVELGRYLNRSSEVVSLSQDVAGLEREIAALREVLAHRDDERFREQLARQQGFVYPDEILYRTLR